MTVTSKSISDVFLIVFLFVCLISERLAGSHRVDSRKKMMMMMMMMNYSDHENLNIFKT